MDIKIKQTKSDGRFLVTRAFGVEKITGRILGGANEEYMRVDSSRIGELKIPAGGRLEVSAI